MSSIIDTAIKNLSLGKIIGFPTDTVYGIACDASNEIAVKKLYEIKNRESRKPLQIMVASPEAARELGIFTDKAKALAEKFWPGALTLVIKKSKEFSLAENISHDDTIGIRIPDDQLILELLRAYGKPIAATSANISGADAAINSTEAEKILGDKIEFYIKGSCGSGLGSTVVDATGNYLKILRQGTIKI